MGEGGFGKVILVKKKASDGNDERFSHEGAEEVPHHHLLQRDLHDQRKGSFGPCIRTSIYYNAVLVLPNKGNFQFFERASYFQRVINTEIYHQFENVLFRCICKIAKMDYELHHVYLAVHLSVCVEQFCSHWTLFH